MLQGNIRSHLSSLHNAAPPLISSAVWLVTLKLQTAQNKYHIILGLPSRLCGSTIIFLWITGKVLRSVIGFQAKLSIKQPLVRGFLFPFIDGEIDFLGNEDLKSDLIFSCHEIFRTFLQRDLMRN